MSPASKKPVSGAAPVKAGDSILVSDDTLFETPALGVFISKNGALQRGVVKSGKVKPLEALASTLNGSTTRAHAMTVHKMPIHILSGTGEPDLAKTLGFSKELADALKLTAQAISAISIVGTVVSVAITAMEWLGLFGEEENPYDVIYSRIEQHLRLTLKTTLAGQTLNMMQQLNMLIGHAETAGRIAGAYMLHPTPARQAMLLQADYWSDYALNTLRGEPMWLRTYDADASPIPLGGVSGWQFGPNVSPNLLMWDWRLALLAYLKALTSRIAVIHAIDPGVDLCIALRSSDMPSFCRSSSSGSGPGSR